MTKFAAVCRKTSYVAGVPTTCFEIFGPDDIARYVAHMRMHGMKYPRKAFTGRPMESTKQGLPPAGSYRRFALEAARLPDLIEEEAA